ncbi:YrrS family protein [Niallia sp. 03133]|uniref:YrrS family protein n=1 Tax=Niallia sp. 03133 TaxID=3458060 RepID=UPI004044DC90
MSSEANNHNQSRSEQRSKRKKTNFILNSLIVIVILLIVFVSYSIFSNNDHKNADKINKNKEKTEQSDKEENQSETVSGNPDKKGEAAENDAAKDDEGAKDDEAIVTEGGSDSNVVKTIENPAWEPVGTAQTGEHAASYSSGTDWNEQEKALAYGTGLDESDMVVWFLGNNNKDPQKSIGTVSSKDKSKKFRVYIEWVDGKGWKPAKVEEIKDLNIR